jgi:hypothetical protein
LRGTPAKLGGPNEPQVCTKATNLANLTARLVCRDTTTLVFGVNGDTTRVAEAKTILGALAQARGIIAVTAVVGVGQEQETPILEQRWVTSRRGPSL